MDLLPSILIRPIRPDDTPRLRAFLGELSLETRYLRFNQVVSDLTTERDRLVSVARSNGIRSFEAFVTPQNFGIRRLLSGGGLALVTTGADVLEASLTDCESAAE